MAKSLDTFRPSRYSILKLGNELYIYGNKGKGKFPWRKKTTPYRVFVSEFFLQRTRATQAALVFEEFIKKFPNLKDAFSAGPDEIDEILHPLGLYHRTLAFRKSLFELKSKLKGEVPKEEKELLTLFGVGKYLARAVLCFGFKRQVGIIDPNITRVFKRYFGLEDIPKRPHTSAKLWELADKIISTCHHNSKMLNWALIDIGRDICIKRNPRCNICPLLNTCQFSKKSAKKRVL